MDLYVFSDESGVFDYVHNKYFVFGGVLFLSKEGRDICARKYTHAESVLRASGKYSNIPELKASIISNSDKGKLFRSLSQYQRFAIIINQNSLLERIFKSKKDKQRYLDYAYKIGLRRLFEKLIRHGDIVANDVENLYVYVDEHTTATNGKYELREALEQEFKSGTYNRNYSCYFPPVFNNLKRVDLNFCNSAKKPLIRAADIVANRLHYLVCNRPDKLNACSVFIVKLP